MIIMFDCPYKKECENIIEQEQQFLDNEWNAFLGNKKNLLYYLKSLFGLRETFDKPICNKECYIYKSVTNNNYEQIVSYQAPKEETKTITKKRILKINKSKGDKNGNK